MTDRTVEDDGGFDDDPYLGISIALCVAAAVATYMSASFSFAYLDQNPFPGNPLFLIMAGLFLWASVPIPVIDPDLFETAYHCAFSVIGRLFIGIVPVVGFVLVVRYAGSTPLLSIEETARIASVIFDATTAAFMMLLCVRYSRRLAAKS